MNDKFVVVITGSEDPMWPFLLEACSEEERNRLILLATDAPRDSGISYKLGGRDQAECLNLKLADRLISDQDIQGVWWRRIILPELNNFEPALRDYCHKEYRVFLEDLEYMLPHARWVSLPSSIKRSNSKALQLLTASKLGFTTLPSMFTNDPESASKFAVSAISVYKSIESPRIPLYTDMHSTVFTTLLQKQHDEFLQGVLSCPGIFQRFCDKRADVRVTVINNTVFSVKIDSQTREGSKIDFRMDAKNLPHLVHDLPEETRALCLSLTRSLGLKFGAIDLGLMEDGSYIFFEINPNGQWGWLEDETGLPMRRTLLDYLFAYNKG